MSYTDVFGGNLIFPSRVSYLALTTAIDVALQWPTEQQITGQNVVADIIDANTTALGLTIDMPDARPASTGNKATFNNVGANSFTVRDATGGTIQQVLPGEQWVLSLTDNTTDAGSWTTFQLGGNAATPASAAVLAGAGIKAIGAQLNQKIDSDVQAATPFTIVEGDRATCQIYTAGAGVCNLPNAAAVGNDWFFLLRNSGSGTLNIVPPAGLIDGAATINLDPNGSAFIFTDGVNWFTVGLTIASTIAFDFVSIPVPGSGDFVLSGANLNRISYRFTGALTGNRRIVVPNTNQQYWVDNQTTGAFTLSISTAAQGGPPSVNQGDTVIFYCDATDVINAVNTAALALPILISQGGTSATTAPNALLNLGAAASALVLTAGDGLTGGGDLTAPRQFDFNLASIAVGVPDTAADFFVFEDVSGGNVNRKALLNTLIGAGISGVPVNNQIAIWIDANNIEGDANFTFSGGVAGILATPNITGDATELSLVGYDENDDGLVIEDGARITFEDRAFANHVYLSNEGIGGGSGTLTLRMDSSANLVLAGPGLQLNNAALSEPIGISVLPTTVRRMNVSQAIRTQGPIYFLERAAANSDFAADGQLWVRSDVPNTLMFTRDDGTDVPIVETGSFTIDFDVGFAGANVVTIQYIRIGDLVHVTMPAANLGNSNAGTLGTGADWPAALRPASIRYGTGSCSDNNGAAIVLGSCTLDSAGVLSFFAPDNTNPPNYGNNWTAAGVKGLAGGWSWSYRITDS